MNYLLDTNILLRLIDLGDPMHGSTSAAVTQLLLARESLFIVPQNLYEF